MAAKRVKVSDMSVNSYGFRLYTPGIDMSRFNTNPVMLYLHDQSKLLGKWNDLKVTAATGEVDGEPVFNSKNAFAAEREQEFNDGFLNGASMGLMPPFRFALYKDCKADLTLPAGTTCDDNDLVLMGCTLSEITLCAIPSNENALQMYDERGYKLSTDKLNEIKLSFQNTPKTNTMDRALIISTLGLKADATDAEITLAMQNLKNSQTGTEAELAQLRAKEVTNKAERINLMIQEAIDKKKILPTQKDAYLKLAQQDPDGMKVLLDGITPVVNLSQQLGGGGTGGAAPTGRDAWTFEGWREKDPDGLNLMMNTEPDKFNKLYIAQYGKMSAPKPAI